MITYLRGEVISVTDKRLVVEVGQVGFQVAISARDAANMPPAGEEVLVAPYIDRTGRLAATMNVYPHLATDSPYQKDSRVKARIYEMSENFGLFAAVDDRYSALIPKQEAQARIRIGDVVQARVTAVLPDGRLNLSVREKAYLQLEKDAEMILKVISEYEGVLPFDDKVSPEIIRREFSLSKNAFKRAVGHLLKEGKVEIRERRIFLKTGGKSTDAR